MADCAARPGHLLCARLPSCEPIAETERPSGVRYARLETARMLSRPRRALRGAERQVEIFEVGCESKFGLEFEFEENWRRAETFRGAGRRAATLAPGERA